MFSELINWDEDLKPTPEEEYRALLRSLRRRRGFGLLFVRCSPVGGDALIHRLGQDLSDKTMGLLQFDQPIDDGNFYRRVEAYLADQKQRQGQYPQIIFVKGIEHSLYDYEDQKRSLNGWNSKDIYSYSLKGVPRILTNLNQQRERFRDNFQTCFVFLIPLFVFKYLIHRAPDFFDWRSGTFNFPTQAEEVERGVRNVLAWPAQSYSDLAPQECMDRLLKIQNLIEENHLLPDRKAELYTKAGLLYNALEQHEYAIDWFDRALSLQPNPEAFWGMAEAFSQIDRHPEALTSYTAALDLQADYPEALYGRGNSLSAMGAYRKAIADYTQALTLRPNYQDAIVKVVSLQSLLSPQTMLKQQVSDRLYRRLRTATKEGEEICRAIALRITQELLNEASYPSISSSPTAQRPNSPTAQLMPLLEKGRNRVNQCLRYYRMGSRKGRIELHSILASLAFPYLFQAADSAKLQRLRTNQGILSQITKENLTLEPKQLEDIEDFLQTFYIETLDLFRNAYQLSCNYQPQTLLELSEYMAFTERYSQQSPQRSSIQGFEARSPSPSTKAPAWDEPLIALRAQNFMARRA